MTARDLQGEGDYAEFTGWLEAQGYNPDPDMVCDGRVMRDAFMGGMQAARDLAAVQESQAAAGWRVALEMIASGDVKSAAACAGVAERALAGDPLPGSIRRVAAQGDGAAP